MSSEQPTILIVGTGALATLMGARLSNAGVKVTMLGSWREGLDALHGNGATLIYPDGRTETGPVRVLETPRNCRDMRFALVLVKSWATWRAARQLQDCLAADGVALTLQNGLGNREALAQSLGAARVALGVTTIGAHLMAPGRAQLAGDGVISLGIHSRLRPLAEMLRAAGFVVEDAPDPDVLLWGKLVLNAAINPLAALLRVPNGELLKRPTARALMVALAREAAAVAVAQGIRLPYPDPVVATETIARRTAANRSSMLQDVLRGAPTEIDAICGAVLRAGEQTNVATPLNRTVWQLIKALEAQTEA